MRRIITTDAPDAIGPYSQAIEIDGWLFGSGQVPIDPKSGLIPEGIELQTAQVCKNIQAVLNAAGMDLTKVVKTTCFLADLGDFKSFNEVYAEYFTGNPARSCIEAAIPKGALVEIDFIARNFITDDELERLIAEGKELASDVDMLNLESKCRQADVWVDRITDYIYASSLTDERKKAFKEQVYEATNYKEKQEDFGQFFKCIMGTPVTQEMDIKIREFCKKTELVTEILSSLSQN